MTASHSSAGQEASERKVGPLDGVRVLEVGGERTQYCGKLLADMGASVVLLEPPAGSPARRIGPFLDDVPDVNRSLHFWYYNTSKRGATLNNTHPDGLQLFDRLVDQADVVIEAEQPGALEALGHGYHAFAARRPALIWASITAFGQTGPYRDFVMTDLTSMAFGGQMASCGYDDVPGAPPIRPEAYHSTHMAGEYAAIGIVVALLERQQSGFGQYIDVSIHEACAGTTEGAFPNWEYFRRNVIRQTGRHSAATRTVPLQYRCVDGFDIHMTGAGVPRNPISWKPLLDWMEEHGCVEDLREPGYADAIYENQYNRSDRANHVAQVIARFVQQIPLEEAYRRAQANHMPWAPVRSPDENLDDPHWRDRGFFVDVQHPELGRSFTYPGLPYQFSDSPGAVRRAPLLGEHTHELYVKELGVTIEELRVLFESGAI